MAHNIKEIKPKIIRRIREGYSPLKAAILSGISDDTYYRWQDKDEEFAQDIKSEFDRYQAEAERKLRKQIMATARQTKNVTAMIAMGDRIFGWTPRTATELTGAKGGQIQFKVDASSGFVNPVTNVLGKTAKPS